MTGTPSRPGHRSPTLRLALAISLAAPLAAAAAPEATVARDGSHWIIQAQRLPRAEVAAQLTRLSGSVVHGDLAALAQARPVTLNWRGGSLAEAWRVLLDGEVSHARRCSASGCELWLVAGHPTTGRSSAPRPVAPPPAGAPAAPLPQADPPGLFPSE